MRAPSQAPSSRLYVLDGLRLVAALLVVGFHFTIFAKPWGVPNGSALPELAVATQFGWLGVYLFFLISGFVICMSAEGRSVAQFATARITRLYPAYWFAVLATTAVLTLWPVVAKPLSPGDVLTNLTMFQDLIGVKRVDVVYWTLSVELRFYLLFGVFVLVRGYTPRRVLLFAAGWLVASLFATSHFPLLTKLLVPRDSACFVAGMALYLIYRHGSNIYLWGLVGASWLVALEMIGSMTPTGPVRNVFSPTQVAVVEAAVMTVFFLIMAAVATRRLAVGWRWLTTAGALTYPLYLLHEFIGWTMIHHLRRVLPPWATLLVVVLTFLVISWLVYRLVEKPVAGWLRRRFAEARLSSDFLRQSPPAQSSAARTDLDRKAASPVAADPVAGQQEHWPPAPLPLAPATAGTSR
ncbi:peptidoglycan/LPS O-acetylase OafA/YrhL [Micromonospora kangleipakensis]|uniref:Peptidoglycan/LPS O-acetylase OafA/YrhL n=1 Tax=Micromonospora kangleipakensis TaxID=1077942 RepID=A0A4Q8B9Y1_9ACTN|nr:acyltransferase [Micromonospora kangleipakensis]RZU74574.1 peptidoglycan/LPS O-acetylase OafA/YrhL [Micromonospora kangleipakensis]